MRQTEIERLNTLRNKVQAGKTLKDKEVERLEQLEDKLQREVQSLEEKQADKGLTEAEEEKLGESKQLLEGGLDLEKKVTAQNESSTIRGGTSGDSAGTTKDGGNQSNSGEGDSRGSREESRSRQSDERAKRNKSDSNAPKSSSETRGSSRQSGDSIGEHGSENRGSESSNRGSSSGGRGDGGRSSRGSRSRNEVEQAEELLEKLDNVKVPAPKVIKPSRKNSRTSKSKKSDDLEADDIQAILMTGFSLIASATRRNHWNISEEEAEAVAVPLDDILQDMTKTKRKQIKKKMAPIMLGSAVAGIVIPRLMIDLASVRGGKKLVQRKQSKSIEPITTQNEIDSISKGDIQSNIGGGFTQHGGDSDNVKTSTPTNDSEIAGLFGKGGM